MAATSWLQTDINKDEFLSCKFRKIAKLTSCIPVTSLLLCLFVSFLLHWDEATETHCKVANYLPSISAAIGGFTPERYIWRIGMALHVGPRILAAFMYFFFFKQAGKTLWIQRTALLAYMLNIVELLSLLVLSYVSSTENFDIHEAAFIVFIVCSMLYMAITCFLLHVISKTDKNQKLICSLALKMKIMAFYITVFALAVYFYYIHNLHCAPGVYTMFALCEYLVVLANIAFHATSIYDFGDASISVGPLFTTLERVTEKHRPFSDFPTAPANHLERKVKREIANSNERRRMQNINTGFDHLKQLVCKDQQEKVSKAGILRRTIDYLDAIEEYNNLLIQQNRTLKKLLAESDKGEMVNNFSSPVKRKLEDKNTKKATKCRKINVECDMRKDQQKSKDIFLHQIYDLRSGLGREHPIREDDKVEIVMKKQEQTPRSFNNEAFPFKGARRSLDSIIEAINQLEGEERLNSS